MTLTPTSVRFMAMMAARIPRAAHFSSEVMKYGRARRQASFRKGPRPRINGLSLAGRRELLVQGAEPGFGALAVHAEVGSAIDAAGIEYQVTGIRAACPDLNHDQVRKIEHRAAGNVMNLALFRIERGLVCLRLFGGHVA